MTTDTESKGRGRRPDPEKREQIIAAAFEMFALHGYVVSVGKIAEAAGVSKQTIYNLFGTKQDLFVAVLRHGSHDVLEAIPTELTEQPITEALTELALRFMNFMVSDRIPQVYRLMFRAPDDVSPELSAKFYQIGPELGLRQMTAYLQALHDKGTLVVPDPELAAEAFFGILKGHVIIQNMLGLKQDWSQEDLRRRADYCVSMFLNQHLP